MKKKRNEWVTSNGVICYCCYQEVMRYTVVQHDGYCPICGQPIDIHEEPYNIPEDEP